MEVLKNIHHQRGEVMIAQGILPFRYEAEGTECGMTALAGLPAYLELGMVCGLSDSIRRHMKVWAERTQGWTDWEGVMALVLLNLANGSCVDDVRGLDGDEGFVRVLRRGGRGGVRGGGRRGGGGGRGEEKKRGGG